MPTINSSVIVFQNFHGVSADQVGALFYSSCVTLDVFYKKGKKSVKLSDIKWNCLIVVFLKCSD